ncbi:hypothetical protein B0H19DRAFT_1086310 [Mycena capillaripes]|nr:hypothetical protein B0H19DRAFT_1086310 [Mycena capillaripes]
MPALLRLSTNLCIFGPPGVGFGRPILNHITHLDTFGERLPDNIWVTLECLPSLTHLAIPINWFTEAGSDLLPGILAKCGFLEVFVLSCHDEADAKDPRELCRYFANDARAVVVVVNYYFLEDWETDADGGEDFWLRAERFVGKRRTGEVNHSEYVLSGKT